MSAQLPSLRRNFSYTFLGNVVYSGCQWLTFVVLAKLGTPEVVGQFALGLAVTAPIMLLANLALSTLVITDARREYRFAEYLSVRLVTILIAANVIVGAVYLAAYPSSTAIVVLLVGLSKAIDALADIYLALLQQRQRMDRVGISFATNGAASLFALTFAMLIWHDAALAALGSVIGSATALVAVAVPSARAVLAEDAREADNAPPTHYSFEFARILRLVLLAAPLGVVGMLLSFNSSIPRLIIESARDERALGVFAALASLTMAGQTVITASSQAAAPRLAQYYAAGRRADFGYLLIRLFVIGAALGLGSLIVAAIAGRPLLQLVYNAEYAQHLDVFLWLLGVGTVNYVLSFMGVGVTAMRVFKMQVPLNLMNTLIIAGLSWLLIDRYGLMGAAWAQLGSALFMLLGYSALIGYGFRVQPALATEATQ